MKSGLTKIIFDEFKKKNTLTLEELFTIVSPSIEIKDNATIKHNIRAAIYSLKQREKIKRIGDSTYKKT